MYTNQESKINILTLETLKNKNVLDLTIIKTQPKAVWKNKVQKTVPQGFCDTNLVKIRPTFGEYFGIVINQVFPFIGNELRRSADQRGSLLHQPASCRKAKF